MVEMSVVVYLPNKAMQESSSTDSAEWGYKGPGWYFWDETWSRCYGPYPSEEAARTGCEVYAATL